MTSEALKRAACWLPRRCVAAVSGNAAREQLLNPHSHASSCHAYNQLLATRSNTGLGEQLGTRAQRHNCRAVGHGALLHLRWLSSKPEQQTGQTTQGPAEQPPAYTSDTQHISIPHTGTTNATTATTASFQGSPPSAPDDPASPPPSPPGSQGLMGSGLRLQLPSNPFAARRRTPVAKQVLYRGKGMLLFRFVVRAKVFQLMGFLAAAAFASAVISTSNPNPTDLAAVGALAVGCVVTSYCIWYYSGRYVGELSLLLPERRVVRFSVLDFWGNREDNDVPLERLLPPWRHRSVAEVRGQARQALMPLEVQGDRQYYISVPHGHILNKEVLQKLLYGAPLDEAEEDSGAPGTPGTSGTPGGGEAQRPGEGGVPGDGPAEEEARGPGGRQSSAPDAKRE